MDHFEYAVIPAPGRADKVKGARGPGDRYAATLEGVLNDMARRGWEYVRSDTLPSEERSGLTGRSTVWHNVLVFRRAVAVEPAAPAPAPVAELPPPAPAPRPTASTPATGTASPVLEPVPDRAPVSDPLPPPVRPQDKADP